MTFREKSAWAMGGIVLVAYGWYLATVAGQAIDGPVGDIAYQRTAVVAAIGVVVLTAVVHIVLAATNRTPSPDKSASTAIKRYARSTGSVVVSAAAVLGMVLAMVDAETFWIANVLLAGLVITELASAGSEIAIYRKGA